MIDSSFEKQILFSMVQSIECRGSALISSKELSRLNVLKFCI